MSRGFVRYSSGVTMPTSPAHRKRSMGSMLTDETITIGTRPAPGEPLPNLMAWFTSYQAQSFSIMMSKTMRSGGGFSPTFASASLPLLAHERTYPLPSSNAVVEAQKSSSSSTMRMLGFRLVPPCAGPSCSFATAIRASESGAIPSWNRCQRGRPPDHKIRKILHLAHRHYIRNGLEALGACKLLG
jgi:hypothetical protein